MTNVKYASIDCNEKFINIYTETLVGNCCKDPLGYECFQALDADLYSIGDAVLKALDKSRDLTLPEEDRNNFSAICSEDGVLVAREWLYEKHPEWKLFDKDSEAMLEASERWWKEIEKIYKVRSKEATFKRMQKNMQNVAVRKDMNNIKFKSLIHDRYGGWGSTKDNPAIEFSIPSSSPVDVVGAAAKYAIGNCRGKGADLIRGILFPEGQPETFEDYLKELELSV